MSNTLTTTGATPSSPVKLKGGEYFFDIRGTWGGTSIALQWSDSGESGTFNTLKDLNGASVALTDDHNFTFKVSQGFVQLFATGGTGISLIYDIGEVS